MTDNRVILLDGRFVPDRELVGGKALSIAEMMAVHLPVPPAFVVTTDACRDYFSSGALSQSLRDEIAAGVRYLEDETGRTLGAGTSRLLVSVRSGAAISMPGMMDTVLNLGMTPDTEQAIAEETGNAGFAHNLHRRFVEVYSSVVLRSADLGLSDNDPREVWNQRVMAACGKSVPLSADECLMEAIQAVFDSWNTRRARRYRAHHGIPDDLGTAVTVQAMVFGNLDERSGTGVLFSRDPLTGNRSPYGEYLSNAQGEDVVSGKATPEPISILQETLPDVHAALMEAAAGLERHHADMQDIEFTVEAGRLYLLQCRTGKRAADAAARIAVDMVREGLIDERTALHRVSPQQARALLAPKLAPGVAEGAGILLHGEAASPGVGAGLVVSCPDEAERLAASGEDVVLARPTTSPEDIHGMIAAKAVMTEKGGSTSHAAVVSRSIGVPCVVGVGEGATGQLMGDKVTVDGGAGRVFPGILPTVSPGEDEEGPLAQLTAWAREYSPVSVVDPEAIDLADVADVSADDQLKDDTPLEALFEGHRCVMGGPLGTDEGVHAAVSAGVEEIVGRPALPILLAAVQACRKKDEAR